MRIKKIIISLFILFCVFPTLHYLLNSYQTLTSIKTEEISSTDHNANSARKQFIHSFKQIAQLPNETKKKSAIYIPRSNDHFWGWPNQSCANIGFLAPALSEVAMIDGLPPQTCKAEQLTHAYFYEYTDALHWRFSHPIAETYLSVCSHATTKGFFQVFVFNNDGKYKKWICK